MKNSHCSRVEVILILTKLDTHICSWFSCKNASVQEFLRLTLLAYPLHCLPPLPLFTERLHCGARYKGEVQGVLNRLEWFCEHCPGRATERCDSSASSVST